MSEELREEVEIARRGPGVDDLFSAPILSPWMPCLDDGVLRISGWDGIRIKMTKPVLTTTPPLLRYYPSLSAARVVGSWVCLGEHIGRPEQLELLEAAAEIQLFSIIRQGKLT